MKFSSHLDQTKVSASDNFSFQILCKASFPVRNIVKNFSLFIYESATTTILNQPFVKILPEFANFLAEFMLRTLAPLRRIAAREIEVFSWDRIRSIPQSFVIHDVLECGHEHACLSWDVFDLLNAYTDNPEVRSRRHRCQPCAELVATKKPPQSVRLVAQKAGVA